MGKISELKAFKECPGAYVLAVNDTLNVINGKWKAPIISTLFFGKKRFGEMAKEIPKITTRMLSKELRDLEANCIVTRTVHDTIPVTVEYELTKSGHLFRDVLDVMLEWGLQHRKSVMKKKKLQ